MGKKSRAATKSQVQTQQKSIRNLASKDTMKSVLRSANEHKTGILSTLIGGALMFYGYRKKSVLATFARTVGTTLFGRGMARVPIG